ncbi:MAG: hypothetical protein IJJ15_05575 [Ruminococcus sp.]|nr:hypothetical protein [Ruminococcus sp.]
MKHVFFVIVAVWIALWWGFFLVAKLILEKIPSKKRINGNIMNTVFVYSISLSKEQIENRIGMMGEFSGVCCRYNKNTSTLYFYYPVVSDVVARYRMRLTYHNGVNILRLSQKGLPWTTHRIYLNVNDYMTHYLQAKPVRFKDYANLNKTM